MSTTQPHTEPLLVVDTTYLCHRAFHAMGDLTHGSVGTGAVYGVLKDIVFLQDYHQTNRMVFVFDLGQKLHRQNVLQGYKSSRRQRHAQESGAEKEARDDFQQQCKMLRTHYLPGAGFNNVFSARGFEADDIIASICADVPPHDEAIIIAADQDLWQCLRENVWMWNPHKKLSYTRKDFRKQWGFGPAKWPDVKAYAGCSSDDVPGVRGAGEATVAKFLRGELPAHHKVHAALVSATDMYERNIRIVRLPYEGTPKFTIQPDAVTEEKWCALARQLGMKSLVNDIPRCAERKKRGRKRNAVHGE